MSEKIEYYRYENIEQFKKVLSGNPQNKWMKQRNLGGGKVANYEPIEIKEALADRIFRTWEVSDEKYMNVLNEIVCTVKIIALPDYPEADHMSFTGSASKPVQCDKGAIVHEFPKGKKANALEYCLPAVRSEAIANALETLGNLFGRNVGRKVSNDFGFDLSYKKDE
tara:strand:+ start:2934 stop:3434 length:501 start_codon:yes stop_codon:yes gene_type:complete